MPIYVVIDPSGVIPVERVIDERDRCDVAPGVWFVRSDNLTSDELSKSLEISSEKTGIVVATNNFAGYAKSTIIAKVSGWESPRAS